MHEATRRVLEVLPEVGSVSVPETRDRFEVKHGESIELADLRRRLLWLTRHGYALRMGPTAASFRATGSGLRALERAD
ncbi:MAG: hypothetical protein B7733_21915 [Myxococcales bacterium FL481]|nr:MAG: hypothetical protein B7733_21915 [Myxococcales bacterium FL481]